MPESTASSLSLPQLIAKLFQQTYASKTATNLFDQISPLMQKELFASSKSTQATLQLLWARILYHLVTLFQDDSSKELLEKSLEASRICLISNKNNNNNNLLQLNFMIREVQTRLFPKVRVSLATSAQTDSSAMDFNDCSRIMIAPVPSSWRGFERGHNYNIAANEIICEETPFAVWNGKEAKQGLDVLKSITTTPNGTINIINRAKADCLWCPDMYLSEAISTFLAGAKSTATRRDTRDVAALRANCHSYFEPTNNDKNEKVTAVDQIAIFDVLSKISHSCSPNCFYDGTGRLVTNSSFPDNNSAVFLSFPYFHRKFLLRGTIARREALYQGHNFVCGCNRCANSADPSAHGRCFVCKNCGSSSTVCEVIFIPNSSSSSSSSLSPSGFFISNGDSNIETSKWMCSKCNDTSSSSSSEMQKYFSIEARLEQSTMAHLTDLAKSVPKNIFEKLKSDMLDCVNNLGKKHWLYLECTRAMIQFFLRVALPISGPSPSQTTRAICLEFALRWTFKFVSAAKQQEIISKFSPSAATSYAAESAKALLEHCPNSEWRIHAALVFQVCRDLDESFLNRNSFSQLPQGGEGNLGSSLSSALELAGRALKIYNDNNEHSWTPQSGQRPRSALEAILRTSDVIDADEAVLLSSWETHLADRVSALLQRQQQGTNAASAAAADQIRSKLNLPNMTTVTK